MGNTATGSMDQMCGTFVVQRRIGGVTHVYVFYVDSNQDLVYQKSTDAGTTWAGSATAILDSTLDYRQILIWYSSWTSGSSGTLVHLAVGTDANSLRYFSLDLSTDTVGTNNNIQIHSGFTTGFLSNGNISVCEATNGEIFVSLVASAGPVGLSVFRSLDAGATWSGDIVALGAAEFDDSADLCVLVPLITNDDVLLIGIDDEFNGPDDGRLKSVVFNNATDTWDATSTTIEDGPSTTQTRYGNFAATIDKTTGDVYLAYFDEDLATSSGFHSLAFRRYDQGTRTWGSKVFISGDLDAFGIFPYSYVYGVSICRDQTDGILMVMVAIGDLTESNVYCVTSSNNGDDWGDGFYMPGEPQEEFAHIFQPTIMLDQNDGWYSVYLDNDFKDLVGNDGPIPLANNFFEDVVTENDTTTVSGATVVVQQTTPRQIFGLQYGKNRPTMGIATTDGSGNYKVYCPPIIYSEPVVTLNFQAYCYEDNGGVGDKMDLSREASSA